MTTEELHEVKRMVLQDLPRVLEQDPGFVVFIEGIISERFPRRDEFARLLDELTASRQENQQRFEQVDQRFEQVDRRFDGIDRRLDGIDQRYEQVVAEIRGLRAWMELNVGGFQTRAGRRLEDVVAGAFCYGLERQDIHPDHVKLRQKIVDEQGLVYRAGKAREVDLIVLGPEVIVFEVKSTADYDDIDDLADKVKLVQHLHPDQRVQGVLVMLGAEADHRRLCTERGLRLIP